MKFAKTLLPGNNFPEGGSPDLASTSRSWGRLWDSRIEDREALGQKHRWLQQVENVKYNVTNSFSRKNIKYLKIISPT